jgi:hypothetical protein
MERPIILQNNSPLETQNRKPHLHYIYLYVVAGLMLSEKPKRHKPRTQRNGNKL